MDDLFADELRFGLLRDNPQKAVRDPTPTYVGFEAPSLDDGASIPLPDDFTFHRAPLRHQLRDFLRFREKPYFGLLYEQRARKTKVILDVFRYRYELGPTSPLHVNALLVIAYPSTVHLVWGDELPKDFPPDFLRRTLSVMWRSGRTTDPRTDAGRAALAAKDHPGPVVVAMNCEAIITPKTWRYLEWLLRHRRVMVVADESSFAGNWSARTRKLEALGRRPNAIVRAILDGTPCEEGPGELFHPCRFLGGRGGSPLGYDTKDAFKARYYRYAEETIPEVTQLVDPSTGLVETRSTGRLITQRIKKQRHAPDGSGRIVGEYEIFEGYQNLPELWDRLLGPTGFCSRVLRSQVSDAPPKTYQMRYFELTETQRRVYDELRKRYTAELIDGSQVTAANVLLRMTRLQMIERNYYPPEPTSAPCSRCAGFGTTPDESEPCPTCDGLGVELGRTPLRRIDRVNPAGICLEQELKSSSQPFVIWCRFRQDVTDAIEVARRLGAHVHQYDGSIPAAKREQGYQDFKAGRGDGIVGTILSGLQRGKDLTRARRLIYYSNEFSLRARRQSEDRAEGLDQTTSTDVIDLCALDTRGAQAIQALRDKRDLATAILRDPVTEWI